MTNDSQTGAPSSAIDLVEASLAAIAERGEATNAFILVDADGARAAAHAVDEERSRGIDRGPMHGVPISVKDLIDVSGQPTTAASRVRAHHVASRDATVVRRLRQAGAIIIGKTNLHEFALGTTNEISAYGPVKNPHDLSRVPGGSSGGSAAAVAAGMGFASIGSDTGGSIRIPAAACGVVGLKPSLGEVPTDGVVQLSSTLDNVGPITRNVEDAASLWAILAARPIPKFELPNSNTLTFGELGGYFTALLSNEVRTVFEAAIERLREAGSTIQPRLIDRTDTIVESYINISLPEASHWHESTLESQAADYQPVTRERLEWGRTIPAVKYIAARETRAQLGLAVDAALEECDVLVLPTLPIIAPKLGVADVTMDNGSRETVPVRSAMLRLTQLFNISGHPAISLPIPTSGMPVGFQIVGRRDKTPELLAIAAECERIFSE
jgi:aspartyl-tRNA(Asn)/glutamyl-tRNA(Gln) amidotransferase subunit A